MANRGILILGNMNKPGVAETIASLRDFIQARCDLLGVFGLEQLINGPVPSVAAEAQLCVVFGGDGTLLTAGRTLAPLDLPLLGVNMGKLGFLADFNVDHLCKHFDDILAGRVVPTRRQMLRVTVGDCPCGGPTHFECLAANDLAISAGEPFRMIDLHVAQGEHTVAQYLGDGLVVSTPTGSTGYNLSAGGPILDPSLEALVITPIAPHALSLRPMVLGLSTPVRITATRVNPGTSVIIDGQVPHTLCEGHIVEVHPAEKPMLIIPHPGRHYFETLSDKLQWGKSPHHG